MLTWRSRTIAGRPLAGSSKGITLLPAFTLHHTKGQDSAPGENGEQGHARKADGPKAVMTPQPSEQLIHFSFAYKKMLNVTTQPR